MKRVIAAVALSLVLATPAQAATQCELVNEYGYWEVRESGLDPFAIYYLYANDGPGGFDPVKLNVANGGGDIRFLLNDTTLGPDDKFQIRAEDGSLVSHC